MAHLSDRPGAAVRHHSDRATNSNIPKEDARAGIEVKDVPAGRRDVESLKVEVMAAEDVHRGEAGGASTIDGAYHDGRDERPDAVLPVVGNDRLGISSCDEIDPDGLDERGPDGNAPPRLGERPHGLIPRCASVGVAAVDRIDPNVRKCGGTNSLLEAPTLSARFRRRRNKRGR